jgi:3-oxoacyl-[acyl-carrier-protein] synthase-3
MIKISGFRIVAGGQAHPTTVLDSRQLEATLPNLEPGWVGDRLGMKTRRVALPHERVVDFGIAATRQALERAGWEGDDLDLVVCGASFLEDLMPSRASVISQAVNPDAVAFDINAACSSALYALAVAHSMMSIDPALRRAAVCVVERPTASADYRDSRSSVFFGDSAACLLVERSDAGAGFDIEVIAMLNDARNAEAVRVPRNGHFHHDNRDAFRHVIEMGVQVTRAALEGAGIDVEDIAHFVGHQANQSVLSSLGDRLGVPWERQWHNFEWAGNQGAAGVLTAFCAGWYAHLSELSNGDYVMLNTVGSGYTGAAILLRWKG